MDHLVRFVNEHPVQAVWSVICLLMALIGSLVGGLLGQLIF